MLDKNILSQLSQLKDEIRASKEYGEGVVAGSNGRFGFVRMEDGRDAFLSPDKMQYLIPGDRVRVLLTKNDKDQLEATVEKLLEAPLQRFLGQYRIKGQAHFAVPLGASTTKAGGTQQKPTPVNRWIFLPPKMRGKCQEGDFIVAKLEQHPFKDGKAFARVIERIGQKDEAFIEHRFTTAKYDLARKFGENAKKQIKEVQETFTKGSYSEGREDLTHLPFVTIDAESTKDMDDALALEKIEQDGKTFTRVHIAIADPSHFVTQGSPLAFSAQYYMQTLYLVGGVLPMLPEKLANEYFSLLPEQVRPALVCSLDFDGAEISHYTFKFAVVKSHHKLSYAQVGSFLDNSEQQSIPSEIADMLQSLSDWANLRLEYRSQHNLVAEEQTDYDLQVDDKGKISNIQQRPRTAGHLIVEEAMVATNSCAGEFLSQNNTGLHTVHNGFREDRLGEVKALLKEESIETEQDINVFEGHLALIKHLQANKQTAHLAAPLRRLMQPTTLSTTSAPHMGMGIPHYATITSPIRRFADLYNHWAIAHILHKTPFRPLNDKAQENINENLQTGRQADRELQQWLICQYAETQIGLEGMAKVRIVTQQGFGARILENGIDGFVLIPKGTEKTFDAKRMTIGFKGKTYRLDDEVKIKLASVDMDKRRIAFEIVETPETAEASSSEDAPTTETPATTEAATTATAETETETETDTSTSAPEPENSSPENSSPENKKTKVDAD